MVTPVKGQEAVYDVKIDGKAYKSFEEGFTGNNGLTEVGFIIDTNLKPNFK